MPDNHRSELVQQVGVQVRASETNGVMSEGRVCDEAMLGWIHGDGKNVATVPGSFQPGENAPEERPGKSRAAVEVDALGNAIGAGEGEAWE